MDEKHFNQKPVRNAEFMMPANIIKAKVGSGGLSDSILESAQRLLESHSEDFAPLANIYLDKMMEGIISAETKNAPSDCEESIAHILMPCVQLKANGAMFQYPLVTRIAERFVQFMEVVQILDQETLEIAKAFHTTIKIVVSSKIKGTGDAQGDALVEELNKACRRYFQAKGLA